LIAVGKGNPDWNNSAPHGAGRLLRRSEAKDYFTVDEFKEQMQGIYTTTVGTSTLDESPMVYKPMDEIVRLIQPTVEIEKIVKPIYNFKAGEQ
ncbi:MAG: RtcB family protein, partial [Clostridiales bacterium]|nr:RtcB family protein [Clostridiales bacterium]